MHILKSFQVYFGVDNMLFYSYGKITYPGMSRLYLDMYTDQIEVDWLTQAYCYF